MPRPLRDQGLAMTGMLVRATSMILVFVKHSPCIVFGDVVDQKSYLLFTLETYFCLMSKGNTCLSDHLSIYLFPFKQNHDLSLKHALDEFVQLNKNMPIKTTFLLSCIKAVFIYRLYCTYLFVHVLYRERPRINSDTVDMKYLASLPDDTFGKLYHDFMKKNVCNLCSNLLFQ